MPPVDPFKGYPDSVIAQGRKPMKITPSDLTDLPVIPKALLVTASGNIAVTGADGNVDTDGVTPLAATVVIPVNAGDVFNAFRVSRVWITGTTATVWGIL